MLTAPNLGWVDERLQDILQARTGLPVVVANDANVAVLAEHGYGDAAGDMMLVTIGHGVGAGLLVAGALVYGSRFAAGEIGQVMVGTDLGLEVTYNRDQVLETLARRAAARAAHPGSRSRGRLGRTRFCGRRGSASASPSPPSSARSISPRSC